MNIADRVLARRYALALYQAAEKRGEAEAVAEELAGAARALSSEMSAFSHPRISAKDKKALLGRVIGPGAGKLTLRFLELLVEKKRFELLPLAAREFGHLRDEGRGIVHASVRAAAELSPNEAEALKGRLGKFIGKTVVLDVKVDPHMIAGAVVRLGDWVFDGSLRSQLRVLQGRLAGQ